MNRAVQTLYVRVLLRLLPHLINVLGHVSPKIRAEADYLRPGYAFMLTVEGAGLAAAPHRGRSNACGPPTSRATWSRAAALRAPTRRL